jgi:hypothetical protein
MRIALTPSNISTRPCPRLLRRHRDQDLPVSSNQDMHPLYLPAGINPFFLPNQDAALPKRAVLVIMEIGAHPHQPPPPPNAPASRRWRPKVLHERPGHSIERITIAFAGSPDRERCQPGTLAPVLHRRRLLPHPTHRRGMARSLFFPFGVPPYAPRWWKETWGGASPC